MIKLFNFRNSVSTSIFWGLVGGMALIITSRLFDKGLLEILPYPVILIIAFLSFRPPLYKRFLSFFLSGLSTFVIMSIVLYLYIITIENPAAIINTDFLGYFWRLGLMTSIGALASVALTLLVIKGRLANGK
jgi:hypothetical protein